MASAVIARVGYGPDYAKMDRPTPPQSEVSFNTYVTRFRNFVHDLVALPWIAKGQVTVDYYPTRSYQRDRRLTPLITWHSQDYNPPDYQLLKWSLACVSERRVMLPAPILIQNFLTRLVHHFRITLRTSFGLQITDVRNLKVCVQA